MLFSLIGYYTTTFSWLTYVLPFINMFALWLLLKKLGKKEIKAFIPVVNSMEQFEIGWSRTAGLVYAIMVIAGYSAFIGLNLISNTDTDYGRADDPHVLPRRLHVLPVAADPGVDHGIQDRPRVRQVGGPIPAHHAAAPVLVLLPGDG